MAEDGTPLWFSETLEKCRNLVDGWDGYGASPISEKTLLAAAQLIKTAVVVPMSNGHVLVEMCGDAVSIELDENGEIVGDECTILDALREPSDAVVEAAVMGYVRSRAEWEHSGATQAVSCSFDDIAAALKAAIEAAEREADDHDRR